MQSAKKDFRKCLSGPVSYRDFRETGPWGPFLESPGNLPGPINVSINVFGDKRFSTEVNFKNILIGPGKLPGLSRNGPLVSDRASHIFRHLKNSEQCRTLCSYNSFSVLIYRSRYNPQASNLRSKKLYIFNGSKSYTKSSTLSRQVKTFLVIMHCHVSFCCHG